MRILHAIHSINPEGGGPIEGILQLAPCMAREGHSIEIASLDAPNAAFLVDFPLPIHPLGPNRLAYGFSPRFVPWLRHNAGRYDVVVVNGVWNYSSFGVWQALRNTSTPYAVFTHGMLDPWFKRALPLKHLKKLVYWHFGEYKVLRDAAAVLFTSEEECLLARRSFSPYKAKEVVVNYGVSGDAGNPNTQIETLVQRFPVLRGKRIALFMGRIHPKKACDLALQSFSRILAADPDWHLVFAGPNQSGWQVELESLAANLGIANRITWTGMVKGDLKWGLLRAAEFLFLPSHQENFGIVVAESLSCHTPVLISDKVNIWREIKQAGAGLVAPDTLDGACSLLHSWIRLSAGERCSMKVKSRQCFERNFEIDQAFRSLANVLATIANQQHDIYARS
jgi:glycosyltransferase involved in cell wall biosynthesis